METERDTATETDTTTEESKMTKTTTDTANTLYKISDKDGAMVQHKWLHHNTARAMVRRGMMVTRLLRRKRYEDVS